ncbi:predicted protein [Botrytis cinerea T4]|uniref:Uncharacterized protein n=1 Tax=Botryotinia fuckeliana (strain T4) TaxID=999810 RepID=G2YM02_BOTF4|nr:predicted protein [Botrytis cinerea T4]
MQPLVSIKQEDLQTKSPPKKCATIHSSTMLRVGCAGTKYDANVVQASRRRDESTGPTCIILYLLSCCARRRLWRIKQLEMPGINLSLLI